MLHHIVVGRAKPDMPSPYYKNIYNAADGMWMGLAKHGVIELQWLGYPSNGKISRASWAVQLDWRLPQILLWGVNDSSDWWVSMVGGLGRDQQATETDTCNARTPVTVPAYPHHSAPGLHQSSFHWECHAPCNNCDLPLLLSMWLINFCPYPNLWLAWQMWFCVVRDIVWPVACSYDGYYSYGRIIETATCGGLLLWIRQPAPRP